MIFAKLDVCIWGHEKFVAAGPAAVGLWASALAYLREHESSDGLLKSHIIGLLLGLGERDARELCEKLVEVGLFSSKDGGYVLLGYASKNETKEQIAARRESTRTRVADFRNRQRNGVGNDHGNADCNTVTNAGGNAIVPGSGSVSDSGSDRGEPERGSGTVAIRPAVSASDDGCFGAAVGAWVDAVTRATGKPYLLPRGGGANAIVDAIRTHEPSVAKRVSWASQKAATWAAQCVKRGTTLSPHKFIDWVNSGEVDPNAPKAPPWQKPEPEAPKKIVVTPEDVEEAERAYERFKAQGGSTVSAVIAAAGGKRT